MRLIVFFVCLCLMLLKGIDNPLGRTYYSGVGYALTAHEEEKHRESITGAHWDCSVFRDTRPVSEEQYILGEDVEDEDPNSSFAYKYRLLARGWPGLSAISVSKYLRGYLISSALFSDQASYRYLLQGVLRI
ncbi:hypothetical protein [Chitinophaga sp. S165]|uniref:hypothetical protein n=1 Tax=Chitinophaga sp. S165 TaxID=2135462 RepID=UPI000D9BFAF3|nr:hypothetical protein [Chitinophaga sp. S165]PWV56900.1 hypothetical protein C7475_1011420 [Chitinophaga sp. S165]